MSVPDLDVIIKYEDITVNMLVYKFTENNELGFAQMTFRDANSTVENFSKLSEAISEVYGEPRDLTDNPEHRIAQSIAGTGFTIHTWATDTMTIWLDISREYGIDLKFTSSVYKVFD